jgi:uncharacterized protein (TIGR03067 family)
VNRIVVCLLALSAVAFAPAPFPKASRPGPPNEITVTTFQGTWRVTGMSRALRDGKHSPHKWDVTHIRIRDDEWTFMDGDTPNTSYRITINNLQQPAGLDFYNRSGGNGEAPGKGIIRRKGDVVEILYSFGNVSRAVSFDPPTVNHWILTLKKGR